jgi:glycosyltransferase involved in cell wall biosynthesis
MKKILFLNQMAGPMFMEMAEDISLHIPGSIVYTGHSSAFERPRVESLIIKKAPCYNRKNIVTRILSWLTYFVKAFFHAVRTEKKTLLFIVSNPPLLGLIGYLLNVFRKQNYIILVYDLYPDILLAFGSSEKNIVIKAWHLYNSIIYSRASRIITIGSDIAARLHPRVHTTPVDIVRCWADTENIKPIDKKNNYFAKEHNLVEKKVLLYSGNMGFTHNIELLTDTVGLVKDSQAHYLFIGDGAKRAKVEHLAKKHPDIITLLPFQPEEVLPYSMACGDIGFVTYQQGTEGCMVPSKAYYYLAAGVCLFVIGKTPNELADTIIKYDCGRVVSTNDTADLVSSINEVLGDIQLLQKYQKNARKAAESFFSRKNTGLFLDCIKKVNGDL